jgi:uncharacterized protein YdaU (DUF1376 family)
MTAYIYLLSHDYETPTSLDNGALLGIYASEADARKAKEQLVLMPGFNEHPNGFHIDRYKINEDHWTAGFGDLE